MGLVGMIAAWPAREGPCCAEAPPRVDCCVALGAELSSSAKRCGVEQGTDWRLWLVTSSLLRSANAWLAVRSRPHAAGRHAALPRPPQSQLLHPRGAAPR